MSDVLTEILGLASVGSAVTCTLSPDTVQVILFALSFLETDSAWLGDVFDVVTEAERDVIQSLISNATQEMLP